MLVVGVGGWCWWLVSVGKMGEAAAVLVVRMKVAVVKTVLFVLGRFINLVFVAVSGCVVVVRVNTVVPVAVRVCLC